MGQQLMKRHARTRPDRGRLLWVGSEPDWLLMRSDGAPVLLCPEHGCSERLHPVLNRRGTRFLRRTASSGSGGGVCHHWGTRSGVTGPESSCHLWVKARLTSLCLQLGIRAVPEDPRTHADVWLPTAATALEVQLRPTDTLGRTMARLAAGARQVVWFLGSSVPASRALFRSPAVRFAVVNRDGDACAPWDAPVPDARMVVYGTVWRWRDWRLATGWMSAAAFLAELLAGRMRWCPPGTPGLPDGRGGWIRLDDLAHVAGPSSAGGPSGGLARASREWLAAESERRARRRT